METKLKKNGDKNVSLDDDDDFQQKLFFFNVFLF